MNIVKGITKTIVRAPLDIISGAFEGISEGFDAAEESIDPKPKPKQGGKS